MAEVFLDSAFCLRLTAFGNTIEIKMLKTYI